MNLIRPQKYQLFPFGIYYAVHSHHFMGLWNTQYFLGKFKVILHWLILLIYPRGKELLIEIGAGISGNVSGIAAIAYHKHLNHAK